MANECANKQGKPRSASRTILFSAGDVSGDLYTARLAKKLQERHSEWQFHALGGPYLGSAVSNGGGTWIADTSGCSAIGLTTALGIYPHGKRLSIALRRFVEAHRIDAVVLCDWGGFNCGHLDFFGAHQIPILYYFPPRSWQRKGRPGLGIASKVARVATPFEWSARRLHAAGCAAEWVGHPLLETTRDQDRREMLRRSYGVGPEEKLIALLPGSRLSELQILAPRMASAADILTSECPAKFIVVTPEPLVEKARTFFAAAIPVLSGCAPDALLASDAAIVKTGTATLEAAVIGTPQVAVYDLDWTRRLEWLFLWMWKRIPFYAMPNIILQRMAIPELLGLNCNANAMARGISELLHDGPRRARMLADYAEVRQQLGEDLPIRATQRTAEILEEMLAIAPNPGAVARPASIEGKTRKFLL